MKSGGAKIKGFAEINDNEWDIHVDEYMRTEEPLKGSRPTSMRAVRGKRINGKHEQR